MKGEPSVIDLLLTWGFVQVSSETIQLKRKDVEMLPNYALESK